MIQLIKPYLDHLSIILLMIIKRISTSYEVRIIEDNKKYKGWRRMGVTQRRRDLTKDRDLGDIRQCGQEERSTTVDWKRKKNPRLSTLKNPMSHEKKTKVP